LEDEEFQEGEEKRKKKKKSNPLISASFRLGAIHAGNQVQLEGGKRGEEKSAFFSTNQSKHADSILRALRQREERGGGERVSLLVYPHVHHPRAKSLRKSREKREKNSAAFLYQLFSFFAI